MVVETVWLILVFIGGVAIGAACGYVGGSKKAFFLGYRRGYDVGYGVGKNYNRSVGRTSIVDIRV